MKKIIDFLKTEVLVLITLILFTTSCNKDNDFGEQPYELNNSFNTSIQLIVSGFENLDGPMGDTCHHNCDVHMTKNLQ